MKQFNIHTLEDNRSFRVSRCTRKAIKPTLRNCAIVVTRFEMNPDRKYGAEVAGY